ncbi:hypothetical protein HWV62_41890 [Athelia sp. TMB]|nr:hypothetical protein HWV62_41890 [Athelia sp. TMB]
MPGICPSKYWTELPFDVWEAISHHLPVKTLLVLGQVSDERSIWDRVLFDILQVVPIHIEPGMTVDEIREIVFRATRLNALLHGGGSIKPAKIQRFELSLDVAAVEIVPGQPYALFMHSNGVIRLHRLPEFANCVAQFPPPERLASKKVHPNKKGLILASNNNSLLAFVSEDFVDHKHIESSEFRVYRLDMASLSMRHLTTVSRPNDHRDSTIKYGLMVVGWAEGGHYFLDIRQLPINVGEVEKSVVVNLGPDMAGCVTSVLCPHKILVATATKLLLYDIPPLHKKPPSGAIFITSVCSFNIREQTHACEGRILWDMIHNHHRGTQSVSVEDQDGLWTLLTLPDQGESVEKLISRATPQSDCRNPVLKSGSGRAMWIKSRADPHAEPLVLQTCVHAVHPDNTAGYMRLGRTVAPDPAKTISINLSGQTGLVRTLTWDESLGRACLFTMTVRDGAMHPELLLVDLLG